LKNILHIQLLGLFHRICTQPKVVMGIYRLGNYG
jgi:hypothetical protein